MNEEAVRAALASAGVPIEPEEPILSVIALSTTLAVTLERGPLILRRREGDTWTVSIPVGQEFPQADQFKV